MQYRHTLVDDDGMYLFFERHAYYPVNDHWFDIRKLFMNKEEFLERVILLYIIRIYDQYYVTNLLNSKITIIVKRSFRKSQLNNTNDLWELWPNSTPKRSHKSYTTDCSLMYILWYPLVEIDNVLSTLSEKIEDIHKPGIYVSLHLFARVHSLISIFQYLLSLQFWII